jgi:hypothetical protein
MGKTLTMQAQVFTLVLAWSFLRYNGLILERFWMQSHIQLQVASPIMSPAQEWTVGSTATGSWKNCHVMGLTSWMRNLDACILDIEELLYFILEQGNKRPKTLLLK